MAQQQQTQARTQNQRPPQTSTNEALERRSAADAERQALLPAGPLTSFQDVLQTYERLRQDFHILTPVIGVGTILPNHEVGWQSVKIDPKPSAKEVYIGSFCNTKDDTPSGQRERALTALALDRIMAAAGVRRVDEESGRVDDRSSPSTFCEYRVTLEIIYLNGKPFRRSATEALDLNDGAPDAMKEERAKEGARNIKTGRMIAIDPNLLKAKRRKIIRLTETIATSACLRKLIGLKQVYTFDELAKDFFFFSLHWKPDMQDPETRTRLLDMATGTSNALYGRPPQAIDVESRLLSPGENGADEPAVLDGAFVEELGEGSNEEHETDVPGVAQEAQQSTPELPEGFGALAPEPQKDIHACGCPCGHQRQVTDEKVVAYTLSDSGSIRCSDCHPKSLSFNLAMHKDLATLGLKNMPEMTPAEAEVISAGMRKRVAEKQAQSR